MRAAADDASLLDDYVRGRELDDVDAYEHDLFARAAAGRAPELAFRSGLAATLQALDARGSLDLWLIASDVARIRASGLRVAYFELDLSRPTTPNIPADADLLITRIPLDLTGVGSLEVEVAAADGRVLKRMPDVSFDPADGAVYACCEAELARQATGTPTVARLWATDARGKRLLAEIPAV